MKIKAKLVLVGAVVVTGMLAAGATAWNTMSKVAVGGPVHAEVNLCKDLIADILPPPMYIIETHLSMKDAVLARDPARVADLRKTLERLKNEYTAREEFWGKELKDAGVRSALLTDSLPPAHEYFKVATGEVVAAMEKNDFETAATLITSRLDPIYAKHRAAIDSTVQLSQQLAARTEDYAGKSVTNGVFLMGAVGGVVLAAVIAALVWVLRSITRPLGKLNDQMRELATGQGDLTQRMNLNSKDELGSLAASVDGFLDTLQSMVRQIREASEQVGAASTQIAASSEEMSSSASEVARQAKLATQAAGESDELARAGGEIVRQTVEGIGKVKDSVSASASGVRTLGERGAAISELIGIINDIADQTNLLALNAAIEAARAGEHGRGFAVVADEVRKLAERTTVATKQVSQTIGSIRTETDRSVELISVGVKEAAHGSELANHAGGSLSEIVEKVGAVTGMIGSMAAAAEQAGAGSQQAATAASQLSQKAEQLQELVGRFRI